MDFNDIQNAWNNEKTEKVVVPTTVQNIQAAHTPLDRIKNNLKKEFIYQIFSIVFMGFIPLLYDFSPQMQLFYYLLFSLFVGICAYYFTKFYFFYKRLNALTLKTKDSLYETYFDIRLNMELYKTFGFALTPFMILFLIGFLYVQFSKTPGFLITAFTTSQIVTVFSVVIFSMLFMGIALEWWVNAFYGKYAKEIKSIINALKEE